MVLILWINIWSIVVATFGAAVPLYLYNPIFRRTV
jgi:hypothetical protein